MSKDYYKILGVDKNASEEEIKKAFRAKAHVHHPDKGGDQAKFKELNEAYQVLGSKEKRAQYDQFGSSFGQGQAGGQGFGDFGGFNGGGFNINLDDLGDMFGDFFGGGGGGRSTAESKRGNDIETVVNLEFREAIFGAEKEISINKFNACEHCHSAGSEPGTSVDTCKTCNGRGRVAKIQRTILGAMQVQTTCSTCSGEGKVFVKKCGKCTGKGIVKSTSNLKVKIPAGIDSGQSIRLSGQGDAGQNNASTGDLYLSIRVKSDKFFTRAGDIIHSQEEISFPQAALGDKIKIETLDGSTTLTIPDGTQSGTEFRLRSYGVPHLNKKTRGDHIVKVIVKTPTKLSRKEKDLYRELTEVS